jgi:hypothetical protein
VFNQLSHYCSHGPSLVSSVRPLWPEDSSPRATGVGKTHYGLNFFTRALPCLTELHSLFYPNGVKIIPENIYDLLTPVALAHLIMGDGQSSRHGLILCTNSFSIQDVVRLMNVLMVRYKLDCNIREHRRSSGKVEHMVYIKHGSMPILRTIVKSYMYPSMLYKLENSKVSKGFM